MIDSLRKLLGFGGNDQPTPQDRLQPQSDMVLQGSFNPQIRQASLGLQGGPLDVGPAVSGQEQVGFPATSAPLTWGQDVIQGGAASPSRNVGYPSLTAPFKPYNLMPNYSPIAALSLPSFSKKQLIK